MNIKTDNVVLGRLSAKLGRLQTAVADALVMGLDSSDDPNSTHKRRHDVRDTLMEALVYIQLLDTYKVLDMDELDPVLSIEMDRKFTILMERAEAEIAQMCEQ